MPERDANGKELSGQQKRKRRREREAAAALAREQHTGERAALLKDIGEFPLDDPDTAMGWYRRAQGILLVEMLKDPAIPVRELFAAVKQMSEAAGKTRDQAALEERLAAIETEIAGSRPRAAVEVKKNNGAPRPPTARGGSRARRPQPMEGLPPRPDDT